MEQSNLDMSDTPYWPTPEPLGSARRVYIGILRDLERHRLVPGQRLVETDLAACHKVGRNAVREAMQHLAVRGVVDLSPNHSPTIRRLDLTESLEVLDVAEAMLQLAATTAARQFDASAHDSLLSSAIAEIERSYSLGLPGDFNRARRHYYRALLEIGGNRELQRIFPAIGMHVFHVQYALPELLRIRYEDYRTIAAAIRASDIDGAGCAAGEHVARVRAVIS